MISIKFALFVVSVVFLLHVQMSSTASIHNIIALLEPVKEDFSNLPVVTNKVKAFDIIPELRKMRALTAASGKHFVEAVVGSLSSAVLGKGIVAKSAIYMINWFLSSLANLVPIEVVEYLMGRSLVMQDVEFVEMVVRDSIEVYEAWSKI
eukprot:TRINITY_DN2036_c0_g2_i6.p1 TRINITY_DN2036_c0_g2~~TRINITY_DN2036_c0_g2_i6.p1  ORF type:complete len:150 (+),score=38.72 TRINITY_DN2036_c0_g2_i6:162-611(+)